MCAVFVAIRGASLPVLFHRVSTSDCHRTLSSFPDEPPFHGSEPASAFQMGRAVASTLILLLLHDFVSQRGRQTAVGHKGRVPGSKTRHRQRAKLQDIFNEYGPIYVRRAYRMKEASFWRLLDLIEPNIGKRRQKRKRGRSPNGDVLNSVRLAMAIHYFAGGDPWDIACVYKVNRSAVYERVWLVVDAINRTKELDIKYATSHEAQKAVAKEFKGRSSVGCAGCVDGILVWIHKPSTTELEKLGIGGKKFFCGRKKKFGLNMQAVCDARR